MPGMSPWLRGCFQNCTHFTKLSKKQLILISIIIDNTVKLRSSQFALMTESFKLSIIKSFHWLSWARVDPCCSWIVHSYLLLRVKSRHGTWRVTSYLLNQHQWILLLLTVIRRILQLLLSACNLVSESSSRVIACTHRTLRSSLFIILPWIWLSVLIEERLWLQESIVFYKGNIVFALILLGWGLTNSL